MRHARDLISPPPAPPPPSPASLRPFVSIFIRCFVFAPEKMGKTYTATVAQLVGALHQAQRSAEVTAAATGESVAVEPIGTAAINSALKYRTRKDRLEHVVLRADG